MLNTAKALQEFWSSFQLPAYTTETVPDDQDVPYITYSLSETEPLEPLTHFAKVYYRSTSNADLLAKVDEILAVFHQNGDTVRMECEGGYVVLRNPTVQLMTDQDPVFRARRFHFQF